MKRCKTRPGVVLTTVGGQYVLVAARAAREYCPSTMQINETAAFCWRVLEGGADADALAAALAEEYKVEDAAGLRADAEDLIDQLAQHGYLIEA